MQSYTKLVHLLLALALVLSLGGAVFIPQTAYAQSEADLSVTKIVDQAAPHSDHTITYTITLTNNGPDTATNIIVTDSLPTGVSYVSDTPSQGTYTSSTGLWSVGSLANGASATLNISAHVDAVPHGTVVTNTASVTSLDQTDPVSTNDSASVNITIQNMCNDLTDCDWSTFGCTANDVNIGRLWLGDAAGVELGNCTRDTTVTAYVWAEFQNNTARDTTAIWACFDFWINGWYIQSISQCEGTVSPGAVNKMIWGPISWSCGHQVTLKNMVISWEGPGGTCEDVPVCGTRKSKCYGPVGLDVVGPLVADFTYTPDTPMCPGTTIQFTDTSFGGVPDAGFDYQYYLWDFGDGNTSTDQNPTHAFDEGGTHNVSLTVTDYDTPNQNHTKSKPVEVSYSPAVTASNGGPACVGGDVQFTGGASLGTAPYIWSWSGPDSFSSSDQSPLLTGVTVAKAGTYTLTVTDDTGCSGNNTTEVVVNDNPTAGITPDPAVACEGVGLSLDGNPAGGSGTYTNHAWTGAGAAYLDNTGIEEPVFTCGTAGTYSLTYTVTDDNGCVGSDSIDVMVNDNPTAGITPDPAVACEGVGLSLDGNPAGGSGTYTNHAWTGAGAAYLNDTGIEEPVFTCGTAGTYSLTYTVTDDNGCVGSDSIDVMVNDNPTAG
ncbi:MAG: PKD domain-containing protein, partial [Dehalococcoidia bacterium]|nr:PKD domain-containing protein [Dehalococcoidia bacterium]